MTTAEDNYVTKSTGLVKLSSLEVALVRSSSRRVSKSAWMLLVVFLDSEPDLLIHLYQDNYFPHVVSLGFVHTFHITVCASGERSEGIADGLSHSPMFIRTCLHLQSVVY